MPVHTLQPGDNTQTCALVHLTAPIYDIDKTHSVVFTGVQTEHVYCMQTFDGERCLYGALNDKIKNLLLHEGFARAGILSACNC